MEDKDAALRLYTLEYQKAAERYENIYRSMWLIFSYMTAVAAGILTFGTSRIEKHALVWVAAIPLLFWFWTTYMPLDRYGNQALNRLREIECLLNNHFGTDLKHFQGPAHELSLCKGMVRAIFKRNQNSSKTPRKVWPQIVTRVKARWNEIHRARFAIIVFFIVLHFVVFYEAYVFCKSGQPLFQEKPAAVTAVEHAQ